VSLRRTKNAVYDILTNVNALQILTNVNGILEQLQWEFFDAGAPAVK
jgi:hypothetical protein